MSTMSLPTAAQPAAALTAARGADALSSDELFSLPAWLYRSEAFAEDLPPAAPVPSAAAEVAAPRRLARPAFLYLATLVLAVAASLPGAISA